MKLQELPKAYEPQKYEAEIYRLWEASGFFNPDNLDGKDYFSIAMPPPNTTGILHLGHASSIAYEDLMIRFARLQGKKALYLPGTDHAAIATQNRVEKLLADEGSDRHTLGRDKFIERTKQFVKESQGTIKEQIRVMGASCDWSRERYTFELALNKMVNQTFIRMYNDQLIYRGDRIVNWCTRCGSTLADDEVEYIPKKSPFYYLKYGPVVIGTARPETKFLDKVIIVHPDDTRYKELVGKEIAVPWISGTVTATVIADEAADPALGTGAMTITPAHSFEDFALAKKYGSDVVQIIDKEGKLTEATGEYAGMSVEEARTKVVEVLQQKGLVEKIDEEYEHNLSVCYRCGTPVQPLVSRQWFVDVNKDIPKLKKSLRRLAFDAVDSGEITIIPERFNKVYFSWINNLHDWCISRQIWWGHRIPVWYCVTCHDDPKKYAEGEYWFVSETKPSVCSRCGEDNMHQDNDTLDTWFSSALWTFSTLFDRNFAAYESFDQWRKNSPDLRYHPTSVMETGYDIIFFWVARMIMMTEYMMGEKPFAEVYLHGMVRDKEGRKMSKSLGNGIDPIDVSQKYGTDALRLSLIIGATPGQDMRLYDEKIAGYRNFVNKLWNISRFVLMSVEKPEIVLEQPLLQSTADRWIWHEYTGEVKTVTTLLEQKQFSFAAESLYEFTWSKFADWYIEVAKIENNQQPETKVGRDRLMLYILQNLLVMWHPFTPFVTELLWQQMSPQQPLLITAWPHDAISAGSEDAEITSKFAKMQEVITAIRNVRAENKIAPSERISAMLFPALDAESKTIIESLARITIVEKGVAGIELKGSWFRVVLGFEGNKNEQDKLKKYIAVLEKKLTNNAFIKNAPTEVVEQERRKLEEAKKKIL